MLPENATAEVDAPAITKPTPRTRNLSDRGGRNLRARLGGLSPWNAYLDRARSTEPRLTGDELRLANALARELIGFGRFADHFGRRLLMEASGLRDTRSFERARDGLIEKELLDYDFCGRGRRSRYELLIGQDEVAAPVRPVGEGMAAGVAANVAAGVAAPVRLRIRGEEEEEETTTCGGEDFGGDDFFAGWAD